MCAQHWFSSVLILFTFSHRGAGVLQGLTNGELSELFREYEIIHPTRVDSVGNFLSFNLPRRGGRLRRSANEVRTNEYNLYSNKMNWIDLNNDIYNETIRETSSRYKNDLGTEQSYQRYNGNIRSEDDDAGTFHFNISAFGLNYHLTLLGKGRLIAKNAKIVWYDGEEKNERFINTDCIHSGHIKNYPRSSVALTSCNGLAGLIKTGDGELFIEPIDQLEEHSYQDRPQRHVVYRRSDVKSNFRTKRETMREEKVMTVGLENVNSNDKQIRTHLSRDTEKFLAMRKNIEVPEEPRGGRNKRHSKKHDYNMEVLLTADDEVIAFHGREHVENYLITLLNIVDEIYHDDSIGVHINIVLVRLALLDQRRSTNLIAYEDPSTSLKNVCGWAHEMQLSDPLPTGRTHDHAIFLTRRKFGPAGYAHVAGMCHPLRSCTLNHEDGFSSAFVVAHETGHVLGMEHDGEGNKCGDETSLGSIMAPLVQAAFHRYHWSRCSQQELNAHIGKFDCLLDAPHSPDWGPTPIYPGVRYSMDDQCRFDFGTGYKRCTAFRNLDVCRILWCSHDDNPMFCKTKNGPPVDGTECGHNMWCFKSHCVWKNQRLVEVDGNWSAWTSFGACSRTCGTGVMSRSRECNNPRPSSGGEVCQGKSIEYVLCSKRVCPSSRDFRAEQCRYHRKVEYANRRHTWLPYENEHDDLKCELFCVSKQTNDVLSMGTPVVDGTPCSYDDTHSICIDATCVGIGCDKVIGSKKFDDDCGVCDGDGSQCRRMNGTYKKLIPRPYNSYMKIFTIPAKARKIRIEEAAQPKPVHILALKNRRTSRYVLNQRNKLLEGDVRMHIIDAGTKWTYTSERGRETISAAGPITSEITVMLIARSRERMPNIQYSYVLHSRNVRESMYQYELKKWYPCSVTCGTGTRISRFGCRNKSSGRWVRKTNCSGNPPRRIRKPCTVKCAPSASWHVGKWGSCSSTCGDNGVQKRKVVCHQQNSVGVDRVVHDRLCLSVGQKPALILPCNREPCPSGWRIGKWSRCSASCGRGIRRRQVTCRPSGNSRSNANASCNSPKPAVTETCYQTSCPDQLCEKDQSMFFCEHDSMIKYCAVPGYRELCCVSCKRYLTSEGDSNPSPAIIAEPSIMNIQRHLLQREQSNNETVIQFMRSEDASTDRQNSNSIGRSRRSIDEQEIQRKLKYSHRRKYRPLAKRFRNGRSPLMVYYGNLIKSDQLYGPCYGELSKFMRKKTIEFFPKDRNDLNIMEYYFGCLRKYRVKMS